MSFGRRMLRDDGAPNRFFLMYLFCEESMVIQYLKYIGLRRSKLQCNTCGRDMTWLGLVLLFLITYQHFLFSIHSSCRFIPTIRIILRLDMVLLFFNNLSPLVLFHSFLVLIHSYNSHYPKVRLGVIFL